MSNPNDESGFEESNPLELRNQLQDQSGTHPVPWFRWVFDHLTLSPGDRILELASGAGELWHQNQGRFDCDLSLVLTDQSVGMLVNSRDVSAEGYCQFPSVALDTQSIGFPGRSFDAVLALGLLDLVPRREQALVEIQRVLRPGGLFVCSAGGQRHLEELEGLLKPFLPEVSLGGEPEQFGLENGRSLLAPYFHQVERFVYRDELVFDRAQPLMEYVLSEPSIAGQLRGKALEGFVAMLRQKLTRQNPVRVTREKALFLARRAD